MNVQLAPGEEDAEIGVTFTPDQALAMASALYEATFYAKSFKDHDVVLRNGLAGGDE